MEITVEALREVAVRAFIPATDYFQDTVFDRERYEEDLQLTRNISNLIGTIEIPNCLIAAFDIDETVFIIRSEQNDQAAWLLAVEERYP